MMKGTQENADVNSSEGINDDELLCFRLANGIKIPKLAMWDVFLKSSSKDIEKCLQSGYRHIILSSKCDRDQVVGESLQEWFQKTAPGHNRNELFITLMFELNPVTGLRNISQQIESRVEDLRCQYIDMIIMYKQNNNKVGDNLRQRNAVTTAWQVFEKLVRENRIRSLSLANFCQEEVELLMTTCTIEPSVLWLNCEPKLTGWKDLNHVCHYCQYKGLILGLMHRIERPENEWVRIHGSVLAKIAKNLKKTAFQVFHRMLIQKRLLVAVAADTRTMDQCFKVPLLVESSVSNRYQRVFDFHLTKDDIRELQDIAV